jgi:DNA-binding NtrC family response regulator
MAILPVAISAQAITLLSQHHYTGHIRELRNLIEYALIKSAGNTIQPQHFNLPAHTADNNQINPPFVQQPTTPIPMPLIDQSADEVTILNYLQHVDVINNLQCQQLINCSHQRASYLLKKLLKTGDIEKQGERRWAVYKLAH